MKKYKMNNGYMIPAMILGTYQIESQSKMDEMVFEAFRCGCMGFDTSPSYGTEEQLGMSIKKAMDNYSVDRSMIFLTDKIDGIQMCESYGNIEGYVDQALKKLGVEYIDLLLIHWPFLRYIDSTWNNMQTLVHKGKVKSLGLSNVDRRIFGEIVELVGEINPQIIQNEISPLNCMCGDTSYFNRKGIIIEAYSSLCRMISAIKESSTLKKLSAKYGKTIPQIILRWNYQRGIIPIFKSNRAERIRENFDIFSFELLPEEILNINKMDQQYRIFPQSYGCPGA